MANYSKLSRREVTKIAAQYGLELLDFVPITGGNSNSNYRLKTNDGDYVLTIAEERSFAEVENMVNLLNWLNNHGCPTSQVLAAKTGEYVLLYAGKPAVLKRWIIGEVHEDLSEDLLEQVGQALARLHQVPAPPDWSALGATELALFTTDLSLIADQAYQHWLREELVYLRTHLPLNLPKGPIHADLFFDNVLFHNGKLRAIIDFEDARYDYLHFDLGMCIVGQCRSGGKVDLSKVRALLSGYEKQRPLSSFEKEQSWFFAEFAATATSRWRYWKYNLLIPNAAKKDKHWEMVNLAKALRALANAQ